MTEKDLIRSILLVVAIYSGEIASDSHNFWISIPMGILCGVACAIYTFKDNKKD